MIIATAVLGTGCIFENGEEEMGIRQGNLIIDPKGIPAVAPIIPREGPWSGDSSLGQRARFAADANNRQTILKRTTDGPPEVWTIGLGVINQLTSINGYNITAEIIFGAGGDSQTIEMDWLEGAEISLPGNSFEVTAKFTNVDIVTEGPGLQLQVLLSRGVRQSTSPARITIAEFATVASMSGIGVFRIPPRVASLYAVVTDVTSARITDFYSATTKLMTLSGTGIGAFNTGVITGVEMEKGVKLPVIGSARFVQLTNGAGTDLKVSIYGELYG